MLDSDGRSVRTLVAIATSGRVGSRTRGTGATTRIASCPKACIGRAFSSSENGRTIVLPNPIRVDTTAPKIRIVRVCAAGVLARRRRTARPRHGDLRGRRARARDDARRRASGACSSKFRPRQGKLVWFGRIGGRPVRPGLVRDPLRAVDRAGNRSVRTRAVLVRVRYVELSRERIEVVAGKRFSVRVRTDARSYRWLFAGKRGEGRRQVLVLRAPETPGDVHALRLGRRTGGPSAGSSSPTARRREPAADRSRRQPIGHDDAARHPRPLAGDRHPGRDVLHPAARAAHSSRRSERVPRRLSAASHARRVGLSAVERSSRCDSREDDSAKRSRRSTRPTRLRPASRAGVTRRRCTCGISHCSSASSRMRSTSISSVTAGTRRSRSSRCRRGRSREPGRTRSAAGFACLWRRRSRTRSGARTPGRRRPLPRGAVRGRSSAILRRS